MKIKTKLKKILIVLSFALITFGSASPALAVYSAGNLVTLTNNERTKAGLGSLSVSSALTAAATAKVNDMIAKNYFAHTSPDGRTPWDFIKASGYEYSYAGENLAIGYTDASELMTAWMISPTHKDNILNSNFRDIGMAVVSGKYNGIETIFVAQEFGAPLATTASQTPTTAGETKTNPTVAPSASASPAPAPFEVLKDKSSYSPASVFAGESVVFKVTVKGNIKSLDLQLGKDKYNLLESSLSSAQNDEKTYTLDHKVMEAGVYDVSVIAQDPGGNSKTVLLGQVEVKPTVIAKEESPASAEKYAGFSQTISRYWYIYLLAIALAAGLGFYFVNRKIKLSRLAKIGMAAWEF